MEINDDIAIFPSFRARQGGGLEASVGPGAAKKVKMVQELLVSCLLLLPKANVTAQTGRSFCVVSNSGPAHFAGTNQPNKRFVQPRLLERRSSNLLSFL